MCEQWAISTPFSLSLSLTLSLSCWLLPLMSVNVSFVPQTAATRALIAFELKSTAKTNNKVQNVKCVTAGEQGRRDVGWAQLLRSSKFAGSEQTVNWASNPNKQLSIDPPAMHLVQFDNNAGAKEHSEANKRLTIAIAIAIARCKWSYALRLWCASAYASTPPPLQPICNAQLFARNGGGNTIRADVANWFGNDNLQLCATLSIANMAITFVPVIGKRQLIRLIEHFETTNQLLLRKTGSVSIALVMSARHGS